MSLSLLSLPLLLSLSASDWLAQDLFPPDPLIGRFRVVEIYPRPLALRHSEIGIPEPLLHLHQQVTIEHIGEGIYYRRPAQKYRFILHGLPLSAAADNAGLPPPFWQETAQATHTAEADVRGSPDDPFNDLDFGARPGEFSYIAAFDQPGPQVMLYVTREGDLIWRVFVDIQPEGGRLHWTSTQITFRLKREG